MSSQNKVYEFVYCYCIYESDFTTQSIHRSKEGAYKAMRKYLNDNYTKWADNRIKHGKDKFYGKLEKFGINEDWGIREKCLLD